MPRIPKASLRPVVRRIDDTVPLESMHTLHGVLRHHIKYRHGGASKLHVAMLIHVHYRLFGITATPKPSIQEKTVHSLRYALGLSHHW